MFRSSYIIVYCIDIVVSEKRQVRSRAARETCEYCAASFTDRRTRSHHQSKCNKGVLLDVQCCTECWQSFDVIEDLLDHTSVCIKDYSIDISDEDLFIRTVSGAHQCLCCRAGFDNKQDLQKHEKTHKKKKKVKCSKCKLQFTTLRKMSIHASRRHTGVQVEFGCILCENSNHLSYESLDDHMRLHFGVSRFVCIICKAPVATRQDGKMHVAEKHKLKSFKFACYICRTRFLGLDSLNCHILDHAIFQYTKCTVCGREFKDVGSLRKHESELHVAIQPNTTCMNCYKRHETDEDRSCHIKIEHESKHTAPNCCFVCGEKQEEKGNHHASHYPPCPLCGQLRLNVSHARKHIEDDHGGVQFDGNVQEDEHGCVIWPTSMSSLKSTGHTESKCILYIYIYNI